MEEQQTFDESDCELELSCSSSEYEVEDTDDESPFRKENLGVKPYQFEPYAKTQNNEEVDPAMDIEDHESTRLQNLDWCHCQKYIIMETTRECACCKEDHKIVTRLEAFKHKKDGKELKCITEHPGFRSVCLDEYVLEAAYSHYRQQYGAQIHNENERSRYTTHRQYVRWIWSYLGKESRVIIPACAVNKIRETFPSSDGSYTGFMYADEYTCK